MNSDHILTVTIGILISLLVISAYVRKDKDGTVMKTVQIYKEGMTDWDREMVSKGFPIQMTGPDGRKYIVTVIDKNQVRLEDKLTGEITYSYIDGVVIGDAK